MILTGNWNYPTTIWAGPGRIRELPAACRAAGITRPLVVTDRGLTRTPIAVPLLDMLDAAGLAAVLFAEIKGNPVGANVEDGVAAYRAGRHDGVVALGGGSGLDVGKAIALMAGQSRPLWEFEDGGDNWMLADPAGIAPVVAVPTTAGTGSEVGRAAVITNERTHRKTIIFHPKMMPALVISDPELTVGLPPPITASTGLDAFIHCFEAWCAPGFHPLADGMALEGMLLIRKYLPRAYANGDDIEARAHMLAAASMGAAAFQKGLGAVHAIAHPVGALYDSHHGLTNAILLPYVMVYNRHAIGERLTTLSRALALADHDFEGVLGWVVEFRRRLGIPHSLAEIGIDDSHAREIGIMAAADPSAAGNPEPVDADALERIFRNAVAGRLG